MRGKLCACVYQRPGPKDLQEEMGVKSQQLKACSHASTQWLYARKTTDILENCSMINEWESSDILENCFMMNE